MKVPSWSGATAGAGQGAWGAHCTGIWWQVMPVCEQVQEALHFCNFLSALVHFLVLLQSGSQF